MFLFSKTGKALATGAGDRSPNLKSNPKAVDKWQDARFGLTVHWGPVALRGEEISWSRMDRIPREEYDALYKDFNPALFGTKEWGQLIADSGFRYATFVAKHHDGFAMWGTKQSDHSILNTPFRRDWLEEVSEELRRRGIIFGTYYSIADWYQYDYSPPDHGGPGFTLARPPDFDRYVAYMKGQLKELIEDYGSEILLFDGEWDPTWTHERGSDLYRFFREVKDEIVVNNRADKGRFGDKPTLARNYTPETPVWDYEKFAGDYQEREEYMGAPATHPWEAWMTLGTSWAWKPNDTYRPAEECIRLLVQSAVRNGNLNLNVTPMLDGRFEQRQKDILLKIGAWLKANGETIYSTRGGPFDPRQWGGSTHRGNKIYLHVFGCQGWPSDTLRFPPLEQSVQWARRLNGVEVRWRQTALGLEITVPPNQRDPADTIVELTL